jgi:hypothetical protein
VPIEIQLKLTGAPDTATNMELVIDDVIILLVRAVSVNEIRTIGATE